MLGRRQTITEESVVVRVCSISQPEGKLLQPLWEGRYESVDCSTAWALIMHGTGILP